MLKQGEILVFRLARGMEPEEVKAMVEPTAGLGDQEHLDTATSGSRWRNTLLIIGFLCILAALFIGAWMKEAAGGLPKFLALGGFALFVICGIWALIDRISHKASRGAQATH